MGTNPLTHNIVCISGGKDSTALLLLALEQNTENLRAVFADTGNEHPLTYEFIQYLARRTGIHIDTVKPDFFQQMKHKAEYVNVHWRKEGIQNSICNKAIELLLAPTKIPFLDLCIWKGMFPSTKKRFCTQQLKIVPLYEQVHLPLLQTGNVVVWQGVRADESSSRAKLSKFETVSCTSEGFSFSNYRPILTWNSDDVFAMHKRHGIEPNPLYFQGMGRVGCMPCIHCRKDELLEIARRFPEELDRIEGWESIVKQASKHSSATFFPLADKHGDGVWQCVEWAKTSRGGKQYDLFRTAAPENHCSSIYGLCE